MSKGSGSGSRAVALLALHEVRRLVGAFRKPSTAIGVVAALAILAALWPVILERGIQPDRGLYPVTVEPGSPLAEAVAADARFEEVPGGFDGGAVMVLARDGPRVRDDQAGHAAYRELQDAVRHWQEEELEREADAAAAFPVEVNLVMAVPDPGAAPLSPSATPGTPGAPAAQPSLFQEVAADAPTVQEAVRPTDVEPPFPVRSLLLTFAFLIPMNFVAQLQSGSLLADRTRKRALISLTTPHAPRTLLLGRSLPYVVAGAAVWILAAWTTGAGWQGWLATAPIILFVLAAALLLGLLARSERELTFLLTGTTTMLSVFLFLPAIFTAVPQVAYLSPVTVLVSSMQGDTVDAGLVIFATLPLTLCALALALVGMALYREETLFSPRTLRDKVIAALAVRSRTRWGVVAAGVLAVPFAFALELLVLSMVIPLGLVSLGAVLVAILAGVALIEERLKLAIAAARRRTGDSPVSAGIWTGVGFFVGEKIAFILAVIGFGGLTLGPELLSLFGVSGAWLLLLAPLVLHCACTAIAASGLGRARPWATVAYFAAVALHLAYNLAAVGLSRSLGPSGGGP